MRENPNKNYERVKGRSVLVTIETKDGKTSFECMYYKNILKNYRNFVSLEAAIAISKGASYTLNMTEESYIQRINFIPLF